MSFKGYLIWYYKTHPRAKRLNTYETVWKTLRQLYYDGCYKVVADDMGKEITNVSRLQCCRRGRVGLTVETVPSWAILQRTWPDQRHEAETRRWSQRRPRCALLPLEVRYGSLCPRTRTYASCRGDSFPEFHRLSTWRYLRECLQGDCWDE
jgi:hypothetical protein